LLFINCLVYFCATGGRPVARVKGIATVSSICCVCVVMFAAPFSGFFCVAVRCELDV
jgi:hypothetical protein